MDQPEKPIEKSDADRGEPARAEPTNSEKPRVTEKKAETPKTGADLDPYWWAPWAVLIGLVLYGLLGFLGVLTPAHKGPTAADVPTPPAPSDTRPVPAR